MPVKPLDGPRNVYCACGERAYIKKSSECLKCYNARWHREHRYKPKPELTPEQQGEIAKRKAELAEARRLRNLERIRAKRHADPEANARRKREERARARARREQTRLRLPEV